MSLAEKLQKVIFRDTGIEIDLPVSINRGYWQTGEVIRWMANEVGGNHRKFECEDSMTDCVRYGVERTPRLPVQDWWGVSYFDVVTKPNKASTRQGGRRGAWR